MSDSRRESVRLITVKQLAEQAEISVAQTNDYINRGLLRVATRKGRIRFLQNPPATQVVHAIKKYLNNHGNLNMCLEELRTLFPDYYS